MNPPSAENLLVSCNGHVLFFLVPLRVSSLVRALLRRLVGEFRRSALVEVEIELPRGLHVA